MLESLYYVTQFTTETLTITVSLMAFIGCLIITYWVYNRRKFHQLGHQIPASVVKNYLDSIIQNSNALKSSLFRGGGLELGQGVPAVVPLTSLPTSGAIAVAGGSEELNQKNAEISSLHSKLAERSAIIVDLEKRLNDASSHKGGESAEAGALKAELANVQKKLSESQAALAEAQAAPKASGGGDAELQKQLTAVTKERDELKERLQEYEIIEEDLANLKRLQQENEMLKKSLESGGGAPAAAAAGTVAAAAVSVAELDLPATAPQASAPVSADVPVDEALPSIAELDAKPQETSAEQKSAEELLNEFEKMLG